MTVREARQILSGFNQRIQRALEGRRPKSEAAKTFDQRYNSEREAQDTAHDAVQPKRYSNDYGDQFPRTSSSDPRGHQGDPENLYRKRVTDGSGHASEAIRTFRRAISRD